MQKKHFKKAAEINQSQIQYEQNFTYVKLDTEKKGQALCFD